MVGTGLADEGAGVLALGLFHDDAGVEAIKMKDSIVKCTARPSNISIRTLGQACIVNLLGINGSALQLRQHLLIRYRLNI